MDNRGGVICALINSNVEELDRATLKEVFSRFGNVRKIFIEEQSNWGKVYFEDLQSVQRACITLNGFRGWEVKTFKDEYKKSHINNNYLVSNNKLSSLAEGRKSNYNLSADKSNITEMEQECVHAGEYVDVHGRPVEVLQAENGQLFVNLDDVRATGFNIYIKESFENAVITKDIDLKHFENYLLNQGRKYILDFKQRFNEEEMLNVFERVRAKLQNSEQAAQFGEGRLIHSPRSKNFTITTTTNVLPTPENDFQKRFPKQLPANFQPSNFNKATKSSPNAYQAGHNENSLSNDRRPQNSNTNRNRRSNDGFRNKQNAGGSNVQGNRFSKPEANITTSKSTVDRKETEESWEEDADTFVAPESKIQSDTSSISADRNLLTIARVRLAPGSSYKVKVSFLPEKNNLFYGQLIENSNLIEEILLKVNTEDCKLPVINKPVRNMLCIAEYEDCWHRAVVLNGKPTPGTAFVEFIDYGNREEVKVREISEAMKQIPGQAIRCTFRDSDSDRINLKLDQQLEIFVKKHHDDSTHVVQIKKMLECEKYDDEPPSSPSETSSDTVLNNSKPEVSLEEECFTEVPPNSAKIEPDENVIVVNYTENKLILRNKETAAICKNVYNHLREMQKKPISDPKVGQLVLCSRDTDEGLHRAVIRKLIDKAAELEFIDYYGGETLALKSLRNMDKVLSSFPSAKIEHGYPVLEHLTANSDALLQDLIFQKKKIKTTQVNGEFDFLISDGDTSVLLSEKIKQLANSSEEATPAATKSEEVLSQPSEATTSGLKKLVNSVPTISDEKPSQLPATPQLKADVPKQESPAVIPQGKNEEEDGPVLIDNMPFVSVELGVGDYSCVNCKGDSVTLISLSDENAEYLKAVDISEPDDKIPYTPELLEMCLAKFEDAWYRALVTEIDGDTYEVLFVDYGNAENINKTDLRRFPKSLTTVPVLGIDAYFVGIPDNPAVYNRLKELIPGNEMLKVDVKTNIDANQRYGIEIPSVYAILKKEGLL